MLYLFNYHFLEMKKTLFMEFRCSTRLINRKAFQMSAKIEIWNSVVLSIILKNDLLQFSYFFFFSW